VNLLSISSGTVDESIGGIPLQGLTEISGEAGGVHHTKHQFCTALHKYNVLESGCGKTQICLTLSLQVTAALLLLLSGMNIIDSVIIDSAGLPAWRL